MYMAFKNGLGREARFNRYFEGYQQRMVIDRNGEEQMKYVYVLNYYRPQLSEKAFIARKVINIVLFLAAAALQIAAGLMPGIIMNVVRYMGFAQCLGILAMVFAAIYIFSHVGAPYTMEIHSYKGAHEKLSIASLISAIILGVIFITAVVTLIVYRSFSFVSFVWAFMYLLAALAILAISILERKTSYEEIPPDSIIY